MPTDTEIIRFLEDKNAMEIGNSPWPTASNQDQLFPIIDRDLFPSGLDLRNENDNYNLMFDGDPLIQRLPDDLVTFADGLSSDRGFLAPPSPSANQANERVVDVLAWYQPIHFFGMDWGIYIKKEAIINTAMAIGEYYPSSLAGLRSRSGRYIPDMGSRMLSATLLRAAFSLLFLHEQYHHKVECFAIRMHVVEKRRRFGPYHTKVYQPNKGSNNQLEESLAGAESFLRLNELRYRKALGPVVRDATIRYVQAEMLPSGPPGYLEAIDYLSAKDFDVGEEVLQTRIQNASLIVPSARENWNVATHLMQSMFSVKSNVWEIVQPGGSPSISDPRVAPLSLPSTRDAEKILRERGWLFEKRRAKGSHRWWSKSGRPRVCLPNRRERLSKKVSEHLADALGVRLTDLPSLI